MRNAGVATLEAKSRDRETSRVYRLQPAEYGKVFGKVEDKSVPSQGGRLPALEAEKEVAASDKAAAEVQPAKAKLDWPKDEVQLALSLNQEEKDVLTSVFAEGQETESLSETEKETLQDVSQRISQFIDQTLARHNSSREQVDQALDEWFSRLTRGERQGPFDLINLFHAAATGSIDK
ncbi:MAG: hypothetical protein LBU23_12495 [Planctomycetota bacterium]|nr:hypothetical protein [Planctomycetota bacterium]